MFFLVHRSYLYFGFYLKVLVANYEVSCEFVAINIIIVGED